MSSSPAELALPEPERVRAVFDRASESFDTAAAVHDETRARLVERLQFVAIEPELIVDLGAATGASAAAVAAHYPGARVLALDSSARMARAAARRAAAGAGFDTLVADATRLPLATDSVDVVVANQLLPFVRPDRLFAEVARVLAPSGLFTFATVGPDTLKELRRAWSGIDDALHVHAFVDMHDLGDLAVNAGLAEPVLDVDRLTLSYESPRKLVHDFRACGAVNSAGGRRRGLIGRDAWRRFEHALDAARVDGRIGLTVEIVLGQAWGLEASGRARRTEDGEIGISLEELRGRRRR